MSFTHTNAPARTSAEAISVPTPLPAPVTSARRPSSEMSSAIGSDFHDDRHDHRSAPRALADEPSDGSTRVALDRLEVGGAFARGVADRRSHHLLRFFEQGFGFGCVDPTAGDDLGAGHDLA